MKRAGKEFRAFKYKLLSTIGEALNGDASLRPWQREAIKECKTRIASLVKLNDAQFSVERHGLVSDDIPQWDDIPQ
jgi:hypothetical protein